MKKEVAYHCFVSVSCSKDRFVPGVNDLGGRVNYVAGFHPVFLAIAGVSNRKH
jgi:hypothetical protein